MDTRRDFIKKSAIGTAGVAIGASAFSAKSYANIIGANDRVNFGVIGLRGRGQALIKSVGASKNTNISYLCDVDSRQVDKSIATVSEFQENAAKGIVDIRELVEKKDVDAIAIAAPDHWHAYMTLLGVKAGKHVYVEKPCSHNPKEGEMLVEAQKKYGKVIQMGNQQRSAPTSIQAVKDIKDGIIGDVYYGKAWYSNSRGSIGKATVAPVPEWLNWELWQGPAPRDEFHDIWVHYNWHWFWNYGTGEINNNGAHEIDICRWALGVDFPKKVTSSGGRYHYDDDWEFYDTQVASFEFEGDKMITWEGKSCNPHKFYNRGRGATIHGTEGTIMLDRNGYFAYNNDQEIIKEMKEEEISATTDTVGAGSLDTKHMANFLDAIRQGEKQNSPIDEGHKSVLLCHLGNIAQHTGDTLETDSATGKIIGNEKAMKMWGREYNKEFEPTV